MPFVICCPGCHYPMTVHEAQAGQVVTCPTCHNPLTAPPLAVPAPLIPPPRPPAPSAPARSRRSALGLPLWTVFVGLLVALVMILFLYDRAETVYQRQRLNAIEDELIPLLSERSLREAELDRTHHPNSISDSQAFHEADPAWQKLSARISKLDYERSRILRAHPGFRR